MGFTTSAALLDGIVLAVVSREAQGTYGYRITQEIKQVLDVSESTLYPVLRRLQKDGCLSVYDQPCNGRNRRYYQVTEKGRTQLEECRRTWQAYTRAVNSLLGGEQP